MKKFEWPPMKTEVESAKPEVLSRRFFCTSKNNAKFKKYISMMLIGISFFVLFQMLPSHSPAPTSIDAMMQRSLASKTDEKIIRTFQTIHRLWMKGLVRFLQLRGYRRVKGDLWERREKYATYRVNARTGEWIFVYEVNPRNPRDGWNSPVSQFFGTKEYDFTGQPNRLSFRFGGNGQSSGSV